MWGLPQVCSFCGVETFKISKIASIADEKRLSGLNQIIKDVLNAVGCFPLSWASRIIATWKVVRFGESHSQIKEAQRNEEWMLSLNMERLSVYKCICISVNYIKSLSDWEAR